MYYIIMYNVLINRIEIIFAFFDLAIKNILLYI